MTARRRLLFVCGALLLLAAAVGVVLHLVVRESRHEHASTVERAASHQASDVRLVGHGPPIPAASRGSVGPSDESRAPIRDPDATKPVLRGRVVTEDGGRPRETRVYLVPKDSPGFDVWYQVPTRADIGEDGVWSMGGDPRGHWIACLASGYRPAYIDGDAWAGEEVVFELPLGRAVDITVSVETDGEEPALHASVRERDKNALEYPGPGSVPEITTYVWDLRRAGGRVHASMDGLVRVIVGAEGFVSTPRWIDVAADERGATFQLTQACGVDLEVRDAETGLELESDVRAAIQPAEGDKRFLLVPREDLASWSCLPGASRVEVESEGYLPWTSDVIRWTGPGQRTTLEARLQPRPDVGRLLLDLEPPPGGSLQGAEPSVMLGRRGADGRLAWSRCPVRAFRDDRARFLLTPIEPGDVHLLVWTGPVGVGRVESQSIHAGATSRARVRLGRGTFVRLLVGTAAGRSPSQGVFFEGETRASVTTADGEVLPLVWFPSRLPHDPGTRWVLMSSHQFRDETVATGSTARANAVLGPYPFEDLVVAGAPAELVPGDR